MAQHHWRVPFHLRIPVEAELNILLQEDVIERAVGPTPWVSPIVEVPKPKNPKEIRLCVNMKHPNVAIVHEQNVWNKKDLLLTLISVSSTSKGYYSMAMSLPKREWSQIQRRSK